MCLRMKLAPAAAAPAGPCAEPCRAGGRGSSRFPNGSVPPHPLHGMGMETGSQLAPGFSLWTLICKHTPSRRNIIAQPKNRSPWAAWPRSGVFVGSFVLFLFLFSLHFFFFFLFGSRCSGILCYFPECLFFFFMLHHSV